MRKRKRVLMWAGLLVVLAGVGLTSLILFPSRSAINRENFEKLREGMSADEVEALFGVPEGDYFSGPLVMKLPADPSKEDIEVAEELMARELARLRIYRGHKSASIKAWVSDTGLVVIQFDERGRITSKRFSAVQLRPESLLDRLRRWLGL